MEETLVDILNRKSINNSDLYQGTDKETRHRYCSLFYENEFSKYKHKPIKILEIGAFAGWSLVLWREYFTKANIVGVDIYDQRLTHNTKNLKDVTVYIQDALEEEFAKTLGNFDIIIDDGEHTKESQIECIKLYLPRLNSGGVLVIEDILELSSMEDFKKLVPEDCTYYIHDTREITGVSDNLIFAIRKK